MYIIQEACKQMNETIITNQRYLGNRGLIAFVTLMNMFIPLSMDLYLPALPSMSISLGSSSAVTNLTLSAFFLFYAIGILFWGPISDKYGRKPVLLTGSIIYLICSIASALSFNIYFLILSRIFQGIGAGGITSVSIAIIKDCYSGKKRESILAVCQSITGLAPMLAPIIGSFILKIADWRATFWVLAAISVVNFFLTIAFQETLKEEERYQGTLLGAIGRIIVVGRNKSFMIPAIIFSLSSIPFMGYIAISAYIYQEYFHLSAQGYSYFFAANALLSIFGPFIYIKFLRSTDKKKMATGLLAISVLSGILVMTVGTIVPILFFLSFVIMSLAGSIMRPFTTNMLLEQQKSDTGSVSSLINTLFTVLGSIGMSVASLPWGDIVVGLGIIIAIFSAFSLCGWIWFMKSNIPCIGVKNSSEPL